MATWLDAVLDTTGLRPAAVTWAAVLGVMTGGGTLIVSVVVIGVLLESTGTVNGVVILAWTVAATQVVAAVLLILGTERLAVGAGRLRLVAGAVLQLPLCAVYVLYALTAYGTADSPAAVVVLTTTSLAFAVMSAGSLLLALHPMTAEYVTFHGRTARSRTS